MNPDDRFLEAALAESGLPVAAGHAPGGGTPPAAGRDVPLRPVWGAIWQLPRWARVAFAARCARLVVPERERGEPESEALRAVAVAENAAARGEVGSGFADEALLAARALLHAGTSTDEAWLLSRSGGTPAAYHAAYAAHVAVHPAGNPDEVAAHTMEAAALAASALATTHLPGAEVARLIAGPGEELAQLLRLAREQGWTDATPVPPTVFGPVWNISVPGFEEPSPDPTGSETHPK